MSIREFVNKRPAAACGTIGALAVLFVGWFLISNSGGGRPGPVKRVFYSDDDGKTYFADDASQIYPFDHGGKLAYRAYVYRCGGEPFVGYLARYKDAVRSKLVELSAKPKDPDAASQRVQLENSGVEVKKPGEKNWVSEKSAEGSRMTVVTCPDGSAARGVGP